MKATAMPLGDIGVEESAIALAINDVLNPEGDTRIKFICLICEPGKKVHGKKVQLVITSNLPFDTTSSNNVAKVLRDAANQIAPPH